MDYQGNINGRLVQARWREADGRDCQDTCLVVDDRTGEATLYPLGSETCVAPAGPKASASALAELSRRPWAFDAGKVIFGTDVLFFAKGREYRLLSEDTGAPATSGLAALPLPPRRVIALPPGPFERAA